jgi:hypothetical protein
VPIYTAARDSYPHRGCANSYSARSYLDPPAERHDIAPAPGRLFPNSRSASRSALLSLSHRTATIKRLSPPQR